MQRYLTGESITQQELALLHGIVAEWRDNLSNISRFMGNLNEYIARKANKEDGCKEPFWESRFNLQAVLDVPALLQTLCYVDLNPVRAKMAKTPDESKHTSVGSRLHHRKTGLMAFSTYQFLGSVPELNSLSVLPISFKAYLALLDWSGRQIRKGKRGSMDQNAPSIMARLGFTPEQWLKTQSPEVVPACGSKTRFVSGKMNGSQLGDAAVSNVST